MSLSMCVFQERDRYAYKIHLPETVEQLRKFNARRKLKVSLNLTLFCCVYNLIIPDTQANTNPYLLKTVLVIYG